MQQAVKQIKQGLVFAGWFAGSIVAGCVTAVSPAQAFSLAGSSGFLSLTQIQPGLTGDLSSFADSDSFAFAGAGSFATALADASAEISEAPSQSQQQSWALASGTGIQYRGTASGFSIVQGTTNAGRSLQFNFTAILGLAAGSDRSVPGEFGRASGAVGIRVFDAESNLLDFLSLDGLISSSGTNLLNLSNSPFFSFETPTFLQERDGITDYSIAVLNGSYSRTFNSASAFSIQGETRNEAIVAVPTPSLLPGLLASLSGIALKRRRQTA